MFRNLSEAKEKIEAFGFRNIYFCLVWFFVRSWIDFKTLSVMACELDFYFLNAFNLNDLMTVLTNPIAKLGVSTSLTKYSVNTQSVNKLPKKVNKKRRRDNSFE